MYLKGINVKQDYPQAFYWFANSCDFFNTAITIGLDPYSEVSKKVIYEGTIAEFNLAWLFENGLGTPKNYSQALKLYSQAAQKGLIEAKQNYSVLSKKVGSFKPA